MVLYFQKKEVTINPSFDIHIKFVNLKDYFGIFFLFSPSDAQMVY